MIEKFSDATAADDLIERRTGSKGAASKSLRRPGTHVLGNTEGAMVFVKSAPLTYEIMLAADLGAKGVATKNMINDCFAYMFTNTDAFVLIGGIAGTNAKCLAMVPHTLGYKLKKIGDDYTFKLRLLPWAKAYGLDAAISEMRANGFSGKADKLVAAAGASR